jgi:zinc transport system substrate-binding protein
MRIRISMLRFLPCVPAILYLAGCFGKVQDAPDAGRLDIVASDTLLSGMIAALLPSGMSGVSAILPPAQCPGHYDVKLSDISRVKRADLIVSMRDMPFMEKVEVEGRKLLLVEDKDRNWMVPDSYIQGLNLLATELSRHFPEEGDQIERRREIAVRDVARNAKMLSEELTRAGIAAMPVIASSMQAQTLQWMGFQVVAEYGRPEAMSAKEIVRLSQIAASRKIRMVVDNLQSGPDAGRGIAEAAGVPHVILSNFPSEEGYSATLRANVSAVLGAVGARK